MGRDECVWPTEGKAPGKGAVKGSPERRIGLIVCISGERTWAKGGHFRAAHSSCMSARSLSTRGRVQPAPRAALNPDSPVSLSEPTSQRRDLRGHHIASAPHFMIITAGKLAPAARGYVRLQGDVCLRPQPLRLSARPRPRNHGTFTFSPTSLSWVRAPTGSPALTE